MPSTKSSTRKAPQTPQERKALSAEQKVAQKIARMRKAGKSWDGSDGIVAAGLCKGAPQGRALLRKHGLVVQAGGIAPSYERTSGFRAAESERRLARAAAAAPTRKPNRSKRAPAKRTATPRKRAARKS